MADGIIAADLFSLKARPSAPNSAGRWYWGRLCSKPAGTAYALRREEGLFPGVDKGTVGMNARNVIFTDVAVLGAGPSGCSAGVEAVRAGAGVIIVEATGELGGNGAFSTGYMAFANSELQRRQGIVDSADLLVDDMVREVELQRSAGYEPAFSLELAHRYASESASAYEFLVSLGFEFGRFIPRPRVHTVDRLLALKSPAQFRELFTLACDGLGIKTMLRHRATQLIMSDGRVAGVVVKRSDGDEVELRAAKGVIVATGGFQANRDMRSRYRPQMNVTLPYKGIDTAYGDGQRMLEAVGCELVNMEMIVEQVQAASRFVEDCIAVNEAGNRFHDETGPYLERRTKLSEQLGGIGYYVFDERAAQRHAQLIAEMPGPPKQFASVSEVARGIGCVSSELEQTISGWNALVESTATRDPDFGRVVFPDPRVGFRGPPFFVIRMGLGVMPTVGGARVTTNLKALHADGAVIPGVFAVGDSMGLLNPAAGLGGIHLGSGVTLGRAAGRYVAAL